MAGKDPNFDARDFRDNIRFVMRMAAPNAVPDQPLFFFPDERVYEDADSSGNPFDWVSEPVGTPARPSRRVTCLADPYFKETSEEGHVGPFRPGRIMLYFFEKEWAEVKTFSSVKMFGVEYFRQETTMPVTLFDATLHTVQVGVEDMP